MKAIINFVQVTMILKKPMKFLLFSALIFLIVFFTACNSQKKIPYYYLENFKDTVAKDAVQNFEPVIQKNDLLYIQVYSAATDPKIDQLYNLNAGGASNTTNNNTVLGYLVDVNGNIEYPRLGIIHAEGLTKEQLADVIKAKLLSDSVLSNPSVIVRFLNFRITVLGEVGRAGQISIPYEKVTILEAIGLAGDIPITGKKDRVRIIREVNGQREFGTVDLTSKDLFQSPYYYLKQNDVLIVDPLKSKIRTNEQSIAAQRISFALSLITSAALLYNIFKK